MTVLSTNGSGAPLNGISESRGRDRGDAAGSDLSASGGGSAGFSPATCWDVVAGQRQCVTDVSDYLDHMEEVPELRSAALLRAMGRLRDELDRVPENANLNDPVTLTLRDALIIARRLLSPLR